MKAIIFTSTYNRNAMLRGCIQDFLNQSYKDCVYSINVACDPGKLDNVQPLYNDLPQERLHICVTENRVIHFNNMAAIKNVPDWHTYDVFIKMDDDDFYKKHYVKNIMEFFEKNPDTDIVSSEIKYQLNGTELCEVNANNLGGNRDVEYKMPMTFAFNKKALDAIINLEEKDMYGFDDMTWRIIWKAYGLKHASIDNSKQVIWHIHGKNVSTASFLR